MQTPVTGRTAPPTAPFPRRSAAPKRRRRRSCRHVEIGLKTTRPTEFIDLTDRLESFIESTGIRAGVLNVQTLHTTTAIVVNEDEPLLRADFTLVLESVAPGGRMYRHDDTSVRTVNLTDAERPNGHAHCRALLLPSSVCLNVAAGRLMLGRWQRVFFVELDGARERRVSVLLLGASRQ